MRTAQIQISAYSGFAHIKFCLGSFCSLSSGCTNSHYMAVTSHCGLLEEFWSSILWFLVCASEQMPEEVTKILV